MTDSNMFLTVAPPLTCQGVINRAKGGKASASSELVSTHAASMAFDGELFKFWDKNFSLMINK